MPAGMTLKNLKFPAQSTFLPSIYPLQQKIYYLIHGHAIKASVNKISNPLRKYNCYVHLDMEQATPEHPACFCLTLFGLKVSESTGGEFVPTC
jgi:hypothetical protein